VLTGFAGSVLTGFAGSVQIGKAGREHRAAGRQASAACESRGEGVQLAPSCPFRAALSKL
jgi:hypothetical protein